MYALLVMAVHAIFSITLANGPIVADSRRLVSGEFNMMNRTVGYLQGTDPITKRSSRCTATATGDFSIITAAHCFYTEQGDMLENIYFYPASRRDGHMPFERYPVFYFAHPTNYNPYAQATLRSVGYDIAVAFIGTDSKSRSLNTRVGFTGIWGRDRLHARTMTTLGYPSDKPNNGLYIAENCSVEEVSDLVYSTNCYIESGQSGSPALFQYEDHKNLYIGGIVTSTDYVDGHVARITAERQHILVALYDGDYNFESNDFNEKWKRVNPSLENRVSILVKNNCSKDVYVAWSTFDEGMARLREATGYLVIKPEEVKFLVDTKYTSHFIHAQDASGRVLIGNTNQVEMLVNNNDRLNFDEIEKSTWGDHYLNLCN